MARQLAEQIAEHFDIDGSDGLGLPERTLRVLDVGCGHGAQAVRLARAGHLVTGIEPDPVILGAAGQLLAVEPVEVQHRVTLLTGEGGDCGRWFGPGSFDVVLCHGVLMFMPEAGPMLASLARVLAPGGMLSVVVRNGDAMAMRPGCGGDWAGALNAFDTDRSAPQLDHDNPTGVPIRADRLAPMTRTLAEIDVPLRRWYGVRVFTDQTPDHVPAPADGRQLAQLLDAEERAGRTDPYRAVAALLHLVGTRRG